MDNFLQGFLSVLTAIYISVASNIPIHLDLNPKNTDSEIINQVVETTMPTPTPLPTPVVNKNIQKPSNTVQNAVYTTPTPSSKPTTDPDPVITCNSKTGKISVKRSICNSYTDCPDGRGGYIFESQDSCKQRWNRIGQDLTKYTKEYWDAKLEQDRLKTQLGIQEMQNKTNQAIQDMNNTANSVSQPVFKAEPLPTVKNVPSSTSKIKCSELKGEAYITQVDCDPN